MTRTVRIVAVAMLLSLGGPMSAAALTTRNSSSDALYAPANSVANYGIDADGVAALRLNGSATVNCSAALLPTRMHLLTAAHCISFVGAGGANSVSSIQADFLVNGVTETIAATAWIKAPTWNGVLGEGDDIAIVTLAGQSSAAGYQLHRQTSVLTFSPVVLAGWGRSGTGDQGDVLPVGTLRVGRNTYDFPWSPGAEYGFDFDDGTLANDSIGNASGGVLRHVGTGADEVMIAPGDSGGPTFLSGQIAGIHSFRTRTYGDNDTVLNSSFGEQGGDTAVASWTAWIDSIVPVPAGHSLLLLVSALTALAATRRR